MKYILAFCLAVSLSGCVAATEPVGANTTFVTVDDDWIRDCTIVPPPEPKAYEAAPEGLRNVMWSRVYIEQAKETGSCNVRVGKARDYNKYAREKNKAQQP